MRQTRLLASEVTQLVASYQGGTTITELAAAFAIDQSTVQAHLTREQVVRRPYRKIRPHQLAEAVTLCEGGLSLRR